MTNDHAVEVEITPEDMAFRQRAQEAGIPHIKVSMYGHSLRRLLADEREACCRIVTGLCISDNNAAEINRAIRARGEK